MEIRKLIWRIGAAAAAIVIGAAIYTTTASIARENALARLEERSALFTATLTDALNRFEHLPQILAEEPSFLAALAGDAAPANARLAALSEAAGVEAIYLMDLGGETIAASNHAEPRTFLGQNYGFRPYFREAAAGARGEFYAIGATTSRPGYFMAAPIRDEGEIAAVLAVKIDLGPLTRTWMGSGEIVVAANADGVTLLSSVDEYRYRALSPLSEERRAQIDKERQFGAEPLSTLDWRPTEAGRVEVEGAAHLIATTAIERPGWALHVLQPLEVIDPAALTALIAYGILLTLAGALFFYVRSQQTAAALRSSISERDALTRLNRRLETEMSERAVAESALRKTEEELARARSLAALGRMAATVTHELGQPLGAMRNYLASADIGGDHAALPGQLTPIVERMEATTRELRSFARGGDQPLAPIDVGDAFAAARELNDHEFAAAGVSLSVRGASEPIFVDGDAIRLEQVFTNLLLNALQAMEDGPRKEVEATISSDDGEARIAIGDSGPGLGDTTLEALAEPFHTTRAAGMGLGLSICQSILRDHGGVLTAGRSRLGGAEFVVSIPLAKVPA